MGKKVTTEISPRIQGVLKDLDRMDRSAIMLVGRMRHMLTSPANDLEETVRELTVKLAESEDGHACVEVLKETTPKILVEYATLIANADMVLAALLDAYNDMLMKPDLSDGSPIGDLLEKSVNLAESSIGSLVERIANLTKDGATQEVVLERMKETGEEFEEAEPDWELDRNNIITPSFTGKKGEA